MINRLLMILLIMLNIY